MKFIEQKELIKFLEKKYPKSKAEKWDFVGYSIKNRNRKIFKILLCLDVNQISLKKAIENNVELIISYHPFCFANKWEDVLEYDFTKKDLIEELNKNKIAVYSIHTNFDQDKKGMKYFINRKLGFNDDKKIKYHKFSSTIEYNDSFHNLINLLKNNLNVSYLLSNINENKKIKTIYIAPGAGDVYEFINKYQKRKDVVLITSDIKWNEQQVMNASNYNFIIIPHKIEDVFVDAIEQIISEKFKEIKIIGFKQDDFIKGY